MSVDRTHVRIANKSTSKRPEEQMPFTTVFGSLSKYEKGTMEIINELAVY